ncbi:hypothetical protein CBM2599_B120064 [Cupriavidus taiwanensis]|nr:hypothetical protein CBM2599_B120064 [Cupriavidus taiwanensis]SOY98264.1 hypothetical protein CBM2600_B130065 [Cupriavidus taiwanensis]
MALGLPSAARSRERAGRYHGRRLLVQSTAREPGEHHR